MPEAQNYKIRDYTPEFHGKIRNILHKFADFMYKITATRKSGDTELIYVLDFLKMLWGGEVF